MHVCRYTAYSLQLMLLFMKKTIGLPHPYLPCLGRYCDPSCLFVGSFVCVFVNLLTSRKHGSGGAISVAAVRQAIWQHVREYGGWGVRTDRRIFKRRRKIFAKKCPGRICRWPFGRLAEVCGLARENFLLFSCFGWATQE